MTQENRRKSLTPRRVSDEEVLEMHRENQATLKKIEISQALQVERSEQVQIRLASIDSQLQKLSQGERDQALLEQRVNVLEKARDDERKFRWAMIVPLLGVILEKIVETFSSHH